MGETGHLTRGAHTYGQLGDGTTTSRSSPAQVGGLTGVSTVAAGSASTHSLALKSDGTLWAWGRNEYGQLGDGSTETRLSPVQVFDLSDVTAVAAGTRHSLALKSTGTVWAWGRNTYGQVGDGTTTMRSSPVQVSSLAAATAVAAGYNHSLAVTR